VRLGNAELVFGFHKISVKDFHGAFVRISFPWGKKKPAEAG
jgi:hypothetical protein